MEKIEKNEWKEVSLGVWEILIPEDFRIKPSSSFSDSSISFHDKHDRLQVKQIFIRSGNKTRSIYSPNSFSKAYFRKLLKELYSNFESIEGKRVAYGFLPGRSVVDQAKRHIGFDYSISLDIQDFFDSIKPKTIKNLVSKDLVPLLFVNGAPRQGLPTSPIISNIAFNEVDSEILKFLDSLTLKSKEESFGGMFVNPFTVSMSSYEYTRYADDLTISLNDYDQIPKIINGIQRILFRYNFELNTRKTKILHSKNGRRIICGVAVDDVRVYPTRKLLKKMRAATHQSNFLSLLGLRAWNYSITKKNKTN